MYLGDQKVSDNSIVHVMDEKTQMTSEPKIPEVATKGTSPAQDLRDIQYLLLNGIFPGNVAPSVVKSYHLLEQMAQQVEAAAKVTANEPK